MGIVHNDGQLETATPVFSEVNFNMKVSLIAVSIRLGAGTSSIKKPTFIATTFLHCQQIKMAKHSEDAISSQWVVLTLKSL